MRNVAQQRHCLPHRPLWPYQRFDAVPGSGTANKLAAGLRARWATVRNSYDLSPGKVVQALGWTVRQADLGASEGAHQALLVPMKDGKFEVVIDPAPAPDEEWAVKLDGGCQGIRRSRIAHELGHAVFYGPQSPPRRLLPWSEEEERFCDTFALALLAPSAAILETAPDAYDLAALAVHAGVSIKTTAEGLCREHPDMAVAGGWLKENNRVEPDFTAGHHSLTPDTLRLALASDGVQPGEPFLAVSLPDRGVSTVTGGSSPFTVPFVCADRRVAWRGEGDIPLFASIGRKYDAQVGVDGEAAGSEAVEP